VVKTGLTTPGDKKILLKVEPETTFHFMTFLFFEIYSKKPDYLMSKKRGGTEKPEE
jgi:hypothetical protein